MTKILAVRYHDFSMGHRVVGHENKCKHLHGHNYRVTFYVAAQQNMLDDIGRVVDFGVIKTKLCNWLEQNWDHKMMLYIKDEHLPMLRAYMPEDIVEVTFNPTAENMAQYLVQVVGPNVLKNEGLYLHKVEVQETRKCSAIYEL